MERVHKMVETKDIVISSVILLGILLSIGGFVYNVYDIGEELTCRTGNGWVVLAEHDGFFESECQYKTKDWVKAYCSSFRSTNSYERYGCNEVVLVEIDKTVTEETVIDNTTTEEIVIDKTVTEETIIHEGDDGDTIIYEGDTIINYPDNPLIYGSGTTPGHKWICPPNKEPCVLLRS